MNSYSYRIKLLAAVSFGFFLILNYQNCSPVAFTQASSYPTDSGLGPTTTGTTLRNMKPALAVRGMACLMCHANIQANVITDFGNGEPWFMAAGPVGSSGDGPFGVNFTSDQGWYNNLADTWQTATIQGSVDVPNVAVPSNVISNLGVNSAGATVTFPDPNGAPVSLVNFMNTPYTIHDTFGFDVGSEAQSAMSYGVTPASGASPVVGYNTVRITSYEDSDILALLPTPISNVGFSLVNVPGVTGASLNGLKVVGNSTTGQYVTNTPGQTLTCTGADVVVQGPLLLSNASIDADNGGCRFYVAGSVFIEGPINYVGQSNSQNLQITSSRVISMGVGSGYPAAAPANPVVGSPSLAAGSCYPSCNALQYRLLDDTRGAQISGTSFSSRATQILADAATVGWIQDAQDLTGVNYATGKSYNGYTRASISYSHVLFNAPIIYSRYLGETVGTMISDIALFSLGEFKFEYDNVFENVPIFPLLPLSPLDVE
jgi:hypothetical protein